MGLFEDLNFEHDEHLDNAYDRLIDMEDQLKGVIGEGDQEAPVMIDANILKSLVKYLEHLDYIHSYEIGESQEIKEEEENTEDDVSEEGDVIGDEQDEEE